MTKIRTGKKNRKKNRKNKKKNKRLTKRDDLMTKKTIEGG